MEEKLSFKYRKSLFLVDAILNHMAGGGAGEGFGVAGSYYKTGDYRYDEVPYDSSNFNPACTVDSSDPVSVRDCRLKNLQVRFP